MTCSKSKVIMEFKKKENKLKISGRAAAVEETKASAEELWQTLVSTDYEIQRPGKCFYIKGCHNTCCQLSLSYRQLSCSDLDIRAAWPSSSTCLRLRLLSDLCFVNHCFRGRGDTGSRGSVDRHFFEYAVHMRLLTPTFCQLF